MICKFFCWLCAWFSVRLASARSVANRKGGQGEEQRGWTCGRGWGAAGWLVLAAVLAGSWPAHAELLAIEKACRALNRWRLSGCTLYVTTEPCPMCAGAIVNARIDRLVYGCDDPKGGAVTSLFHIGTDERLNHQLEVVRGIRAEECAALLKDFFKKRRGYTRHIRKC